VTTVAVAGLAACTGHGGSSSNGFRFTSANPPGTLIPRSDREPAGTFTADRLDGSGTFRLSRTKGQVVVVNYWASNCAPCRTEMPAFDRIYRADRDNGVTFVGVDTKEARSRGIDFVRGHDISYPNVSDETGKTSLELGDIAATALPFTVLIDKQGDVAGVYIGALTANDLEPMLRRLRAET
jgi:thiol-disulfide isomerase/thioredoxin